MTTFAYETTSLMGQLLSIAVAKLDMKGADGTFKTFQFEVDTGASLSLMPASAARILGLNPANGTPITLYGVSPTGADSFQIMVVTVPARFTGDSTVFPLQIGIGENDNIPFLLGRLSVWGAVPSILLNNVDNTISFGQVTPVQQSLSLSGSVIGLLGIGLGVLLLVKG